MTQHATIVPLHTTPSVVEPATVVGFCDPEGFLPVRLKAESTNRRARMAIHPRPSLGPDDEVLTSADGGGTTYIVGVLDCKSGSVDAVETIRLTDGCQVRIDRSADEESMQLRSQKNELLVDYRSQTGTLTIHAASGNLEFSAPEGNIAFRCARDIQLDGNRVSVNAGTDVLVGIQEHHGGAGPALSMQKHKLQLKAPMIDLTAQRANCFVEEIQVAGRKLLGRIKDIQLIARKMESAAETIMAKAKNVYQTISELSQLKAGRQRTLIDQTVHMKARKTIFKSETDFKVKAEKIHLG
jgi:hypothetical protein